MRANPSSSRRACRARRTRWSRWTRWTRGTAAAVALVALAILGLHTDAAGAATAHHQALVAGTVAAVDAAAGTLTIAPLKAGAVTLAIDAQTRLSLDGAAAKLADIPVGAEARALYDATTKVALRIQALSPPKLAAVEGMVTAVTAASLTIAPEHGSPVTLGTNSSTRVILDGVPSKLSAIAAGDQARALYDRATGIAEAIEAESPHHALTLIEGQVTAVTASSLTIAPEHGAAVALGTAASTVVILDGAPSTLSAITVGDEARALYDSSTLIAEAIEAESPHHAIAEVQGQVTAVTASSLTIAPEEGSPVTLGTAASTVVILDGAPATLSQLAVGDQARALYDSGTLIATVVQAQAPQHRLAEIEGQVTAVGSASIAITPDQPQGAAAVTLGTTSSTQIFLDGALSSLGSIAVGDSARALYDTATRTAILIAAEAPRHALAVIDGTVTAVGAASLTIAPESGEGAAPVTLGTSASTQILLDFRPATLAALAPGDHARALYDTVSLIASVVLAESSSRH